MENKPLLSLVVPVYNAEKFLPVTLRNIVDEQFAAADSALWELILVNDGSTDGSGEIIRRAASQSQNIRVIDQKNAGASSARNAGLRAARGEYVYFIDSDDLLAKGALSIVLNVIKTSRPDLIKFLLRHISPQEYDQLKDSVPQAEVSESDIKKMSPREYLATTEAMTNPSGDCTWLTVYRRSLLVENSLEYDPKILIGEDVDLIWRTMFCVQSIVYIPVALYLYHIHAAGITGSVANSKRRLKDNADLLDNMLGLRKRYSERPDLITPGADTGFRNTIRYLSNHVLSLQVVLGEPLSEIFKTMRRLKRAGVDIHPGRPRFERSVAENATVGAKIRRWFVAYILVLPVWLKK